MTSEQLMNNMSTKNNKLHSSRSMPPKIVHKKKVRKFLMTSGLLIILITVACVFMQKGGRALLQASRLVPLRVPFGSFFEKTKTTPAFEPSYRVEIQYTDDKSRSLQKPNTPMDACRIMTQCFSHSKTFGKVESCQPGIETTMKYYDSGFLIESFPGKEDEVVGFISVLPVKRQNNIFIFIYNVCIDGERRRKGLGSKLMNMFVEKYVSSTNWPRDKIFLALDVDLRTPLAAAALSLYAKLGYVRWMEPCKNVYENDVSRAIYPPPSSNAHLSAILTDPHGYAKRMYAKYQGGTDSEKAGKPYPTHFCMYRKYEETFEEIGKALSASVSELDRKSLHPILEDDD